MQNHLFELQIFSQERCLELHLPSQLFYEHQHILSSCLPGNIIDVIDKNMHIKEEIHVNEKKKHKEYICEKLQREL